MVRLSDLVRDLGGRCEYGGGVAPSALDAPIRDVRVDSREVEPGDLFCALPSAVPGTLPGARSNGADFARQALERGAVAVLAPDRLDLPGAPVWVHPEARRIVGLAASEVHGHPSRRLWVVAVTGTNGKSTVAHLVAHMLGHLGRRPALIGTVGYRVAGESEHAAPNTTPDAATLQRLLARHLSAGGDCVALEASSHGLAQHRLSGVAVDVAVFTNLTRDHLDYHRNMEEYAAAKALLFSNLDSDASAIVNQDDPHASLFIEAAKARGARVFTFSTGSRADLFATRWIVARQGTRLSLQGMGISGTESCLPLPGRHNVENALAALAAVLRSGASPSDALEGLATASPPPGRLEPVVVPGLAEDILVLVDYAHTPDALRGALETVRELVAAGGRLICVFGCGGDRDPGKRAPMGRTVGAGADLAFVTSDNPRSEDPHAIVRAIEVGLAEARAEVVVEVDRRRAIHAALRAARSGDVVLIAGKGHETVQIGRDGARPFDDRRVAQEAFEG